MNESDLLTQTDKSFFKLGGGSASAITLLYHINQEFLVNNKNNNNNNDNDNVPATFDSSATDILWSKSLNELNNYVVSSKGGEDDNNSNNKQMQKRQRRGIGEITEEDDKKNTRNITCSRTYINKIFVPKQQQIQVNTNSWH